MLNSVQFENFKSYESAELRLGSLTVLIGANASGKSNAIEALRLLSWIAQGNRLSALKYPVYESRETLRGTTTDLVRRGADTFSFIADLTNESNFDYRISIACSEDGELHIVKEALADSNDAKAPLFEVVSGRNEAGGDLRVAYNNFARGGKKPQVVCIDQVAVLIQMQAVARMGESAKTARIAIPRACKQAQETLARMVFLDPQPAAMRNYSFKTERRLNNSGSNISGVLFNICQDLDNHLDVLDSIKSLPEQNIENISFIHTPRGEAMLQLTETFGNEKRNYDASLLSDGTLRVLAIAAALLSAEEQSLVVIEEIDNGVHPSRAMALLNRMAAIAKRRKLKILVSSHNPALLDAVPDDAVGDVVLCYRDPQTGASQLVRLQDLQDYPELIAQGSVGRLMTSGILERFVKTLPTQEERARRAKAWLAELRDETVS